MKRARMIVLVIVLGVLLVCGTLAVMRLRRPPILRVPEPEVPAELVSLPRDAWVTSADIPKVNPGIYSLMEFPAVMPDDLNSAYKGKTGVSMGEVISCTQLSVLERSWSEIDGDWWVLVRQGDQEGWLMLDEVQFEDP